MKRTYFLSARNQAIQLCRLNAREIMSSINFRDSFSRLAIVDLILLPLLSSSFSFSLPSPSFFTTKPRFIGPVAIIAHDRLRYPSFLPFYRDLSSMDCSRADSIDFSFPLLLSTDPSFCIPSFSALVNKKTEKWRALFHRGKKTRAQHLLSRTIGCLLDSGLMRGCNG